MDLVTGIQKAINYIEDNLLTDLDYDKIAKEAHVSSFHFQRIFHILSGFTLGEYIRNRRLSLAATALQESSCKIIDIAMKHGYNSPESFSRAFERFHGVSPSVAKGMGVNLKSFSRLSIKVILEGGSVMDYKIKVKKAFKLLTKVEAQYINDIQISKFWERCRSDGTLQHLSDYSSHKDKLHIGMADGSSFNGESYMYYIGTPFEGDLVPNGYITKDIPERTWAVFRCVNLSDQSVNAEIFKKIYSEFFPTSDYEPAEYQLEVWPDDGQPHPDEVAEVWIAVRKKEINDGSL